MFGTLPDHVHTLLDVNPVTASEIFSISPKISRGENYSGLPYVMLDYPRCFGKTDIFAIRTMFWWGNFFSTTLHLKGKYKNELVPVIIKNLAVLSKHHFFISINADEWRHDFQPDNYISMLDVDDQVITDQLIKKDFCKIARKTGLQDWDSVSDQVLEFYEIIFKQLVINSPGGGRGL